jgi:hypothetical protein
MASLYHHNIFKVEAVDLEDIEFTSQRFQLSQDARTPKY